MQGEILDTELREEIRKVTLPFVIGPKQRKCNFKELRPRYTVHNRRGNRSLVGLYPANNAVYKLAFRKP